jgi:hypothetical protein
VVVNLWQGLTRMSSNLKEKVAQKGTTKKAMPLRKEKRATKAIYKIPLAG